MKVLITRWALAVTMVVGVLMLASCATEAETDLEQAQFHLDRGEYDQARVLSEKVLEHEPDNALATFMLASALIGEGFLGEGRNYLDLVADLMSENEEGHDLGIIAGIAPPPNERRIAQVIRATDLLFEVPDEKKTPNFYLQLFLSRAFELSNLMAGLGAASDDEVCNADPSYPFRDGEPDELDPDSLTEAQAVRTVWNLRQAAFDAAKAELPANNTLVKRFLTLEVGVTASIKIAGGNERDGLVLFIRLAFGDTGTKVNCTDPIN